MADLEASGNFTSKKDFKAEAHYLKEGFYWIGAKDSKEAPSSSSTAFEVKGLTISATWVREQVCQANLPIPSSPLAF
jgi:hypothetical protein